MPGIIQPLFSLAFWFRMSAVPFTPWIGWFLIGTQSLLVIGGGGLYLGLKKFAPKMGRERKLVGLRFAILSFWCGAFGFMLYGFTAQAIPIMSMRFFWLVLLGIYLGVSGWLARYWFKILPALDRERLAREAYEKWLPKPKK